MLKNVLYLVIFTALFSISIIEPVFAQEIIPVNSTTPCFLNFTASYNILNNCNLGDDYTEWFLQTWMWITGGYFPMILVSLIIGVVYAHYREAIYAIYIGIVFLPISFMFFPDVFLSWAVIMAFVGIGVLIWYAITKQSQ